MNGITPYMNEFRLISAYWGLVTLLLFGIFLYLWLREPRKLIHGITFTIFFIAFLGELALLIFSTGNPYFIVIMGVLFILIVVLIAITMIFMWALLLWNALIVWKRESHTLSNMLTLFLAIFLIVLWLANAFLAGHSNFLPGWFNILITGLPMIGLYLLICSYNFLANSFLYQFVPRQYK